MLIPFGVFSAGAGNGGAAGSFDLISTTLLTGSQASVTFDVTGLGATYKHLQIRAASRVSGSYGTVDDYMTFNSSTSGYASHYLLGNGSSVSSGASTSRANMITYNSSAGASSSSNIFAGHICDILDPFSSSKNKTIRGVSGNYGSNTYVDIYSGLWNNTAALTSITMTSGAGSYVAGSRFSLYGIKG